jgi:hypothetical protein
VLTPPSKEDTNRVKLREMAKLAKLLKNPAYLVIHTGAGISTGERHVPAVPS